MAAIARRAVLALFFATPVDEVRETFSLIASDLSEGNLSGLLRHFAKEFPEREEFRYAVAALLNAYDLSSSIQIQTVAGESSQRTAQVDWYLAARSKVDNAVVFQRREVIAVDLRRDGKRWLVTRFDFSGLFAPAR